VTKHQKTKNQKVFGKRTGGGKTKGEKEGGSFGRGAGGSKPRPYCMVRTRGDSVCVWGFWLP